MSPEGTGACRRRRRIAAGSTALFLLATAPPVNGPYAEPRIPEFRAGGTVAGQTVDATVDGEEARFFLERGGVGGEPRTGTARRIATALREVAPDARDSASLQALSERTSVDFAALWFVATLYEDPENRTVQDAFHARVSRLADPEGPPAPPAGRDAFRIAFVPGYGYRRDTTTGADFANQRAILDARGFRTTLIETDEVGLVEENARVVAGAIRRLSRKSDLILVSASKGGPEVALALGELLTERDSTRVKAWISVGGLLRGSPYADRALVWPRRWFAKVAFGIRGLRPGVIKNLSTRVRRPAFESLRLPEHVLSLQYVGVPLSGQVSKKVRGRYRTLRPLGPNDGLTLLADELAPGGLVVTDLGLDHYYLDPVIDVKTVALTYVVLDILENRRAREASTRP